MFLFSFPLERILRAGLGWAGLGWAGAWPGAGAGAGLVAGGAGRWAIAGFGY